MVTLKKNRSAVTVALMVGGRTPVSLMCSWKARRSSAVAVSGARPRKIVRFSTARMYSRCVSGTKLRTVMSSSMRWRSGLTDLVVMGSSLA